MSNQDSISSKRFETAFVASSRSRHDKPSMFRLLRGYSNENYQEHLVTTKTRLVRRVLYDMMVDICQRGDKNIVKAIRRPERFALLPDPGQLSKVKNFIANLAERGL